MKQSSANQSLKENLIDEIKNYIADEDDSPISTDAKNFAINLFELIHELPRFVVSDNSVGEITVEFPDYLGTPKHLRLRGNYIFWQRDDKFNPNYGVVRNLTPQKIKNALRWLLK